MTNILSVVTVVLQSYCDKVYSRNSLIAMWILRYCKDHLDSFNSRFYSRTSHLSKQLISMVKSLQTIPL